MKVFGFSYSDGNEDNTNSTASLTFAGSQYNFDNNFSVNIICYLLVLLNVFLKCQMLIVVMRLVK